MSWINRIENIELEIKTGDGKVYKPLWLDAAKEISYNYESFDFINKAGTYIERAKQSGNQYPVAFYFVGANHLEEAAAFELSAADPNPWQISHPLYNTLYVQPLGLKFDNKVNNITLITGTVWETLKIKAPISTVSLLNTVENLNSILTAQINANFTANLPTISGITNLAGDTVGQLDRAFKNLVEIQSDIEAYLDYVRQASGAAQNVISNATRYITAATNLINFPFLIEQNIAAKITAMINAFNNLLTTVNSFFIQYHGAAVLSNACLNSVSNVNEYSNRAEIVNVIDNISAVYDANIEYFSDPEIALQLDKIINFTLGGLLEAAQNSKQLRTINIETDNNFISLAAKYFGTGEAGVIEFLKLNDLKANEYLKIKAGREINYYV